ncbi:YihY/virulence factor BrkB family protein [Sphingomonas sp. NFR15]|uniref:YihY/virulence factor BrkB family protein n=1 Tax=Sphingomonas sp. NFR15 TaxID=1566282 RepID=UPI00210E028B|nr:YihY/virulence factor BrkB family protein [Sphingomonas sp. NFR15]
MDRQGRDAVNPWHMPFAAWRAVAQRTWGEAGSDNIGLIAAGVAFYGFLALVPLLGATVLVYGIAADPPAVTHDITKLASVMPADIARLIGEQLMNVVETSDGKKGLGLLIALALALFGARNGAGAIITALNIVYEEKETRNFIHVNLLALMMTTLAVIIAILALAAIATLGYLEAFIPDAPGLLVVAGKIVVCGLLMLVGAAVAASLYRYGPARRRARWIWLTPGSLLAALMWLALTMGFGIYVANFGNYNATYGSLGAVVVTLTWLYGSSYILLFGAELNAELEHQTARDTTGVGAPIGERGAWVADHVADDGCTGDDTTEARMVGIVTREPSWNPSSVPSAIVVSRIAARAGGFAGLPNGSLATTVAATVGLSLLRKGKAWPSMAVLGGTAALVWLRRHRPRTMR